MAFLHQNAPQTTDTRAIIGRDTEGQFIGTVNSEGQMHLMRTDKTAVAQFARECRKSGMTFTGRVQHGVVELELII